MNAARFLAEELLEDSYDDLSVTFKLVHGVVTARDLAEFLELVDRRTEAGE